MTVSPLSACLAIVFVAATLSACEGGETRPPVVEVTAMDYAFGAPESIASGWTTLRLDNQGREIHFLTLWRLPEGKTLEDYVGEVLPAFGEAYGALQAGTADKAEAGRILGERLPEWYGSVIGLGGVGFVDPGRVAETIVELEPGEYVMECYVQSPEGRFHGELGMLRPLTVTDDSTGASPPAPDIEITLSNAGIDAPSEVPAGPRTVAVHYAEHPALGLGNDVHVVRLDEETDLDAVARWMDWMNLDGGLRAPAPAEFLGGIHEMPAGRTAYFTVDLAPGRHAWIGETSAESPRVEEFTVE